jgi:hypothetical protein
LGGQGLGGGAIPQGLAVQFGHKVRRMQGFQGIQGGCQ